MALEKLVSGEVISYKGGQLLLTERHFDSLSQNPIVDYIKKHKEGLALERIRKAFPELHHVPKRDILFFDIETCGLSYDSPIFAIGLAHLNHEIETSCLFARDYSEEKSILQLFLDLVPQYHAFFSYNGNSFDLPRLDKRMQANGIAYPQNQQSQSGDLQTLKDALNSSHSHVDLKQALKALPRLQLPDQKLQTIEKVVFQMSRQDDAASHTIPEIYRGYIAGTHPEEKMARGIQHVLDDTLTLVALVGYICENSKNS